MADNFEIELPEPRTLDVKTSEAFGEYSRRIYHLLGMTGSSDVGKPVSR
jgi:NitT/TauT family transport system ATP-binding protein